MSARDPALGRATGAVAPDHLIDTAATTTIAAHGPLAADATTINRPALCDATAAPAR